MTDPPVDLLALMPFAQTLGVEVLAAGPDEVRARLFWRERLCTAGGVLHGGVLMALGDSTGALCAYLNLPDSASTTTIESKTNFHRAVADGHVDAGRVAAAPLTPFIGQGFRHLGPRYDPLSGEGARLHGGRFNPPGSFPVLYICQSSPCAVAELKRLGERQAIGVEGLLPRVPTATRSTLTECSTSPTATSAPRSASARTS
jgi:uncharacterized protein (TIGR00369 family)